MRFKSQNILLFITFLAFSLRGFGQEPSADDGKKVPIFGRLLEADTKEAVIGALVTYVEGGNAAVTDIYGDFKLRVLPGEITLEVRSVSFKTTKYKLIASERAKFEIKIESALEQLDDVIITGKRVDENVKSTDIGKSALSIESIKKLPMTMGEIDIIKSLSLLPGVSTSSELSTGFNVRGGGSDQNLILLGDVPIYNPSHLFGFYSAFNSEVIDDVSLYKGGVPAQYGGRASSVLAIKNRDGDYQRWKSKLSIGVVSSKITAEGPIIKDKLSILTSLRKSYVNWAFSNFKNADVQESSADFYDFNVILNYRFNDNNKLNYSIYRSKDDFNLAGDTLYAWTNYYHSLTWYHSFSANLNFKLLGAISQYDNSIENESIIDPYTISSGVNDKILKADLEYIFSDRLKATFGSGLTNHTISPGELEPENIEENSLSPKTLQDEYANEWAIYGDATYNVSPKITLTGGLRYNRYNYLGSHVIYDYEPYRRKSELTIIDSTFYADGESIQKYSGFEPRLAATFLVGKTSSIKLGYNRMYQYIQLISNTTTIAPNDIWKLSDDKLKPQISDQVSLGFYKNFQNNKYETSIEGYYKEIENIVDYKDGADLFLNDHIESELLSGQGRSYGLELYLRKTSGGRALGWISYTYSKSERQIAGAYAEETINDGEWYYANFDRAHNFTTVFIYKLPKNWEFSSTFNFKTGQPVTYPAAKIQYNGNIIPFYNQRNNTRSPVYHRLDVSFTKKFKFLKQKTGEFNFSVYNLYGRDNPFSIFFQDFPGSPPQPYQLAILGIPFPSASFNFEF